MIKVILVFLSLMTAGPLFNTAQSSTDIDYNVVSEKLLKALKNGEETAEYEKILEASTMEGLEAALTNDKQRLAFWINVYNSHIILILRKHPEYFEDRRAFFKEPYINIGGKMVSFSKIEHGVIRKSQWSLGLGKIRKPFPGKWERKLRVDERDYRIHFALNCGAKSCPPVTVYDPINLDKQLDFQTDKYLNGHTTYDEATNEVATTPLFSWFRGDFGCKKGVKEILVAKELVPSSKVNLKYIEYDWTLDIDNFAETPYGR